MASTEKFQHALFYALLPVSPSLSALHSVRTGADAASCQKCGTALHRGESCVRTVRSRGSRSIQTICLVCGCVRQVPLARGNAALYPRTGKRQVTPTAAPDPPPQAAKQPVATPVQAPAAPKSRSKKKIGLESMLKKNRERESKEQQSGSGAGLAMFLNTL